MSITNQLRDRRDGELLKDERAEFSGAWPPSAAVSSAFLEFETATREGGEGDPQTFFNHGMRLLEFGAGAGLEHHAIEAFRRCTELAPRNGSAFYHLGIALMTAQRYEEALKAFERAAELEQNSPDVLMGLIYASMALENDSLSNAYVERLIDITKGDTQGVILDARIFYCWYGVTLVLADRADDAESFFVLAQAASGEASAFTDAAFFGLAYVALWRGERETAERHLRAMKNHASPLYVTLTEATGRGVMSKEEFFTAILSRTV